MKRLALLAGLSLFGGAAAPQDRTEKAPDYGPTLRAVVQELDHLKRHLTTIAARQPALLADLRRERPDLAGLIDDVEKRVREFDGEMKKLAAALESEDVSAREAARERIVSMGPVAVPHIRELLKSENADVRGQAEEMLTRLTVAPTFQDSGTGVRRLAIIDVRGLGLGEDLSATVRKIVPLDLGEEAMGVTSSGDFIVRGRPVTIERVKALVDALRSVKR